MSAGLAWAIPSLADRDVPLKIAGEPFDDDGEPFEPWASIRRFVDKRARRLGARYASDAADELLAIVTAQVVDRYWSSSSPRGPRHTLGGWPATEDEEMFTDEAVALTADHDAIGFARDYVKCAVADLHAGKQRKGERGGISARRKHVPYQEEINDDEGGETVHGTSLPQTLAMSEDALIAAIDAGRSPWAIDREEDDAPTLLRPLTNRELRWLREDIQTWALRRLRARFGVRLQPCPRPLTRSEAAWCAALPNPGLWNARTATECVLELLASGFRSDIPLTATTTLADVVAYELPSMERALARARARNRHACHTEMGIEGDSPLRQAG